MSDYNTYDLYDDGTMHDSPVGALGVGKTTCENDDLHIEMRHKPTKDETGFLGRMNSLSSGLAPLDRFVREINRLVSANQPHEPMPEIKLKTEVPLVC